MTQVLSRMEFIDKSHRVWHKSPRSSIQLYLDAKWWANTFRNQQTKKRFFINNIIVDYHRKRPNAGKQFCIKLRFKFEPKPDSCRFMFGHDRCVEFSTEFLPALLTQFFEFLWEAAEVETRAGAIGVTRPSRFLLPSLLFLLFDQHSLLFYVALSYLWTSVLVDVVKRLRQPVILIDELWIDGEAVNLRDSRQRIGLGGHKRNCGLSFLLNITLCNFTHQRWLFAGLHIIVLLEFIDVG